MPRPLLLLLAVTLCSAAALAQPLGGAPQAWGPRPALPIGVNFGPYVDGQDPNQGAVVDAAQIGQRLDLIADHVDLVRSFGATAGLEHVGPAAHARGLLHVASAWIDGDQATNQVEVDALIALANAGHADLLVVGSEVLLRDDLSPAELIAWIDTVRAQVVVDVPITTAETYRAWHDHPELLAAVDVVFANFYPFWEGVPFEQAIDRLICWYDELAQAVAPLPVWVSETGWPSAGGGASQPETSPENAALFARQFVSWARRNQVPYLYFAAFDESWKAAYEGPVGAHWGLWTKHGQLKPGMAALFTGLSTPAPGTTECLPGGPGTPTVELTFVPPVGSSEDLEGQVLHVSPITHRLAVYIRVNGLWWTKPTFAAPLTAPFYDGRFVTDITTGGMDDKADLVAVYLLPPGVAAPQVGNQPQLPALLDSLALDSLIVPK